MCAGADIRTWSAEQAVAMKISPQRGSKRRSCAPESRLGKQITDSTSTAAAIPTRNCHRTRGIRTRSTISHNCLILGSTKCNGVRGNARYDENGTSVERSMPVSTCRNPGTERCIIRHQNAAVPLYESHRIIIPEERPSPEQTTEQGGAREQSRTLADIGTLAGTAKPHMAR